MGIRRIFTSVCIVSWCGAIAVAGADVLQPGPNIQERTQEALILAAKGSVVEFGEGVFEFTRSLSLDVDGVTVKGQGPDKTILSFKKQNAGSEGLMVTSDGVTLRDFAVEDTIGDAIKVKGVQGITFFNVRTEWTGGPKSTNGAYGLYPVASVNVLIDRCVAIGASDAGIYVGQSKNVIIHRNRELLQRRRLRLRGHPQHGGNPRLRSPELTATGRPRRSHLRQRSVRQRHPELCA